MHINVNVSLQIWQHKYFIRMYPTNSSSIRTRTVWMYPTNISICAWLYPTNIKIIWAWVYHTNSVCVIMWMCPTNITGGNESYKCSDFMYMNVSYTQYEHKMHATLIVIIPTQMYTIQPLWVYVYECILQTLEA